MAIINGNGKKNTLIGTSGDDTIDGKNGKDNLFGDAGNDLLIGGNANDVLFGEAGNDTLLGGRGKDQLFGGDDNDFLSGGKGKDQLFGGTGDDNYVVSLVKKGAGAKKKAVFEDKLFENAGEGVDTITLTGSVKLKKITTLVLADNFENLDASATGATKLNIIGNAANNKLTGNTYGNVINGGDGVDEIRGGAGADVLTGGAGEDIFVFNAADIGTADTITDFTNGGADLIQLDGFAAFANGFFADMFAANAALDANDYLIYNPTTGSLFYDADGAGAGAQVLIASLGAGTGFNYTNVKGYFDISLGIATVIGNSTGTVIEGGSGNDNIDGGAGDDSLYGNGGLAADPDGNDTLRGGAGDDYLDGRKGQDLLFGDDGNDILYGYDDFDRLFGGTGNDLLYGEDGGDDLYGGAGADILRGGTGNDWFRYTSITDSPVGAGRDLIADFNSAENDKIDLTSIDANTTLAGHQSFTFMGNNVAFTGAAGQLRYHSGSQSVFGDVNGDAVADFQIEVLGIITISATDFLL